MELIELTADTIETYLDSCVALQAYLVSDQQEIDPEQFRKTAQADNYFIALVEDGRVAGMGVIHKMVHPVRTGAYIDNIVVHPDFRGRGLFTVIMDALETKAIKEWGAGKIKLTCSRVPVQPLYEKRSYKEVVSTKLYSKTI